MCVYSAPPKARRASGLKGETPANSCCCVCVCALIIKDSCVCARRRLVEFMTRVTLGQANMDRPIGRSVRGVINAQMYGGNGHCVNYRRS